MSLLDQTLLDRTLMDIAGLPARLPTDDISRQVQERWDSLTKPRGSLGEIETVVLRLAQIQGSALPDVSRPGVFVFCGEHGITAEGVSLYPSAVTREMAKNFVRGGAAINVLSRHYGVETNIVDAGLSGDKLEGVLDRRIAGGTRNFRYGLAMSREEAIAALEAGILLGQEAASKYNIVAAGEMGIGNSTAAAALLCAFTGIRPEDATGRGAGLDSTGILHKSNVIAAALAAHQTNTDDPLGIVAAFGGFEIAMMAGFILGAASRRLPVIIDGFICGAAFLIVRGFYPAIAARLIFGHASSERGHALLLRETGVQPLLDLKMSLGEGTGAVVALGLIAAGVKLYREMATFAEAAVSDFQ